MKLRPSFREWPEDSLPGILEPFLWLQVIDQYEIYGIRSVDHVARVEGIVKGPATVADAESSQDLVNGLSRPVREAMYRQAEDAIAAALAAGYKLMAHPVIDMGGRINHDRETGLDVPCAECRVDFHFRIPDGRGV